jgi:glycosyltransferase involved in cell wall biosynthesis
MRDRLISQGLPPSKIHVAENWADGNLIRPGPPPSDGSFTVLYSGNLGLVHEFDTICTAMDRLKTDIRFRFVFAGAGPRRSALEKCCRINSIGNASFLPYQEPARFSDHLAACHLGLVTQHPNTLGSVVPSKTYALMAAARPILFIGPRAATPARVIERHKCGWQIDPGDVGALVALLHLLASDFGLAEAAGRRARQAFLEHYDLAIGVSRLARMLELSGQAAESVPQALSSG